MEEQKIYLAQCIVSGRTHHSIPTSTQEDLLFKSSENNPQSALEKEIESFISSKNEPRITEVYVSSFYEVLSEIIPEKRNYVTPLKKVYEE